MKLSTHKAVLCHSLATALSCLTGANNYVVAQNAPKTELGVQLDAVSMNVWRGVRQAGVSIQPSATLNKGNFELTAWGTVELCGSDRELDFILTYSVADFRFGITDYWNSTGAADYFSGHEFEFNCEYGLRQLPLTFSWNTVFLGDCKGSSYVEIGYEDEVAGFQTGVLVGITPWRNRMLATGGFALTNLTVGLSKKFAFSSKINLTPSCSLICNCAIKKIFFVAGIGLSF